MRQPEVNIVSDEDFLQWLKTTDASLTFIGDPILGFTSSEGLTPREKSSMKVTYCSSCINNICGGSCTVYNGGPVCLDAPATVCLYAIHDVGLYDRAGCTLSCNSFDSCGTRLDDGFCHAPETSSILVGNYCQGFRYQKWVTLGQRFSCFFADYLIRHNRSIQ
ncbi:hypothetical protein GGF50DRAFT_67701 [Schizophyllum commune]